MCTEIKMEIIMVVESKAKLSEGESLKFKGSKSEGSLQETDVYEYSIINASGVEVGLAVHKHITDQKTLTSVNTFVQKDSDGKVINEERWV